MSSVSAAGHLTCTTCQLSFSSDAQAHRTHFSSGVFHRIALHCVTPLILLSFLPSSPYLSFIVPPFDLDLHRFNAKRQAVELPPLSAAQFAERMASVAAERGPQFASSCDLCHKVFSSKPAWEHHMKSRTHLDRASRASRQKPSAAGVVVGAGVGVGVGGGAPTAAPAIDPEIMAGLTPEEADLVRRRVVFTTSDCLFCPVHTPGDLQE